jgi:CRP/FNR family transcriptional regulator, anaerobic regulatory protein
MMASSADQSQLRPELLDTFRRGDAWIARAVVGNDKVFPPGQPLVTAGGASDMIFRIRTGWLVRSRTLPDGRRQIISLYLPGDLVGVKSLLFTRQPDAIECLTGATVGVIHHADLHRLCEQHCEVAFRLMWHIADEEFRLHKWMISLGRGTAEERLALMFLDLRDRLRRLGLTSSESFRLPMTQQHIGDHLGLTVVHVNRMLRRFREARMMTLKAGMAMIHDADALQRIAGPVQDVFQREQHEGGVAPA